MGWYHRILLVLLVLLAPFAEWKPAALSNSCTSDETLKRLNFIRTKRGG